MSTTHIIIGGTVANTIVATLEEAQQAYPDALCLDAELHAGGIGWLWDGHSLAPGAPAPQPSQFERDQARYARRAAVKDQLLAYMAADNMARVRAGVWSVQDLSSLLDDPAIAAANAYMGTLSYELAAQAIAAATTPLLTPQVRADWIARLQAHFYLEG